MGISIAEPSGSAAYLATLLIAVSNGDDAAFRRFRDATDRKVMKVAMAILRDHHAAEDVAQDVYLSVWNRASSFDGRRGGAIAWLSAMTRNRSLDYLRRPSARRLHDSLDLAWDLSDPGPSPYEAAEFANGLSVARLRLEKLDAVDRSLLTAAVLQETPYARLALADGLPLPTLKSKVRRALMKLAQPCPQSLPS